MDAYARLIEDAPAHAPARPSWHVSEKAVREAVASLPLANPAHAVPETEQLLDGILAASGSGGERIAALAGLRAAVESLCRGIEQQLGGESHPLPVASAERAEMALRLQWKMACNYAKGLHELCAPAGKLPRFRRKLAAAAVVAALTHVQSALTWAYRQYQAPQAGTWRLAHALHGFACELGIADLAVRQPPADTVPLPARAAYLQALLLALSNPFRFSLRELKEAGAVIQCVAGQCGLLRADRAGGVGVNIDTESDAGPGYVLEERLASGLLSLDVEPAARIFEERIALLPDGADAIDLPQPGGGVVTTSAGFLRRLQANWSPAERGHVRLPARHVLDLVIGMHALHYALAGNQDFATFIRDVHGEAITVGRHELASSWLASSDSARPRTFRGEVLDQSEGGYRIRLQESEGARLRIGELIGMSPLTEVPEERDWMVGVIRWLRLEDGHEWLGVELLNRTARAAGVRPVSADGESLVPQRAVELPGQTGERGLSLLVTHHFVRDVATAEVVLPALASDWHGQASVSVWRCGGAEVLGNACIRVNLVRDEPGPSGDPEGTR
jgi:hypothetical protein